MPIYKKMGIFLNLWRIAIAWVCARGGGYSDRFLEDNRVWCERNLPEDCTPGIFTFGYNMIWAKEYRSLVLHRLHGNPLRFALVRLLFKPLESIYLNMPCESIGGGLYLQHGFATIIAARSVGARCSINQQVTVGFNGSKCPEIGNDVTICAGAIIVGDVSVGDGATVGAGAVVVNDVPSGATVVGVQAHIVGCDAV